MSEHLPECSYDPEELKWISDCGEPHDGHCICDRLRACEKRVGDSAYNWGYVDGSKDAREGALREALGAVVAVPYFWPNEKRSTYIRKKDALAAIHALMEGEK